ncbi:hypothetical protein [Streptomyces olivochromogenes]|uniref:Uncharacterized protein n=1 Tax=Streptomyces olivochromogenes TaxID=1963 RepID=A0A250V617_STROL|nr:hypothetical protein [Streptomyces olivochromogenes]KUN49944.1 hypothetical protein AQJ27_00950 [Streptomyces olivochromogenes]GAX49534.1 hypothetical protein SO3561_01023 [Streptomyces olivochromogenes]
MATVFQKCKTDDKNKNYPCEKTRCGHPWTVRYREPGGRSGRQRERSFPTKREGDDHGVEMESVKREGTYLDPKRGAVPLRTYAEAWLELPLLPSRAVDEMLLPSAHQVQDIADEFRREWALSV